MADDVIVKWLRKHIGTKFTASELASKVGVTEKQVHDAIRVLNKGRWIIAKNTGGKEIVYTVQATEG